jgi:hypothetical protein
LDSYDCGYEDEESAGRGGLNAEDTAILLGAAGVAWGLRALDGGVGSL